jgi:nucleoside-diphosphate-sugar epimerase
VRVVVTGGCGKIGQWVVRELLVSADDRPPHAVTVFDRVGEPRVDGARYLVGDVRDLGQVVGARAGADAVIHLATSSPPAPIPHPTNEVIFGTGVLGAFNVHEAAWRLGIRRVVSTSSKAVLGWTYAERDFPPDYLPVDEDHPVRPQDAYGLAKEVGEAIARSYTAKCGMETVVLRPAEVKQPEQMAQMRLTRGRPPRNFDMYTYIDVRDLAEAYRLAVECPISGHVVLWIVADDSVVDEPLSELLPRLLPGLGDMARQLTGTRPATTNARAREVLGWRPRRSWRDPDDPGVSREAP